MSEALKALDEIEAALNTGARWIDGPGFDMTTDGMQIERALSLLPTLRAALAPVADAEIEAIRGRHEEIALKHPNIDWNEPNVWADRATLLRALDAMAEENARLREALTMIGHSLVCAPTDYAEHNASELLKAGNIARAALGQEGGG